MPPLAQAMLMSLICHEVEVDGGIPDPYVSNDWRRLARITGLTISECQQAFPHIRHLYHSPDAGLTLRCSRAQQLRDHWDWIRRLELRKFTAARCKRPKVTRRYSHHDYDPWFRKFWAAFPGDQRNNKPDAYAIWRKEVLPYGDVFAERVVEKTCQYASRQERLGDSRDDWCLPETWLRRRGWEDRFDD